MRRADRLFRVVQVLRNRRLVRATDLADELGVSVRTIYRDIQDLGRSGVPIVGEAGVGYSLHRDYELPPLTFNAAEIESLVLGARMVQAWGDPELAASARSLVTKVEAVLPESLRDVLTRIALFAPSFPLASQRGEGIATLRRTISEHRKVSIRYRRADGEASERTIRPLGLYFWGTKWSLGAWCELRQEYRSFRPDRIDAMTVLDETFDGSDGIDLDAMVAAIAGRERARPVMATDTPGR